MHEDDRPTGNQEPGDETWTDRGYSKPKLTYIEPEFTELGDIKEFTAGFFGSFSAS